MNVKRILISSLGCLLITFAAPLHAQSRNFSGRRFQRQLSAPASIFWSEVPLRDAVTNLSETRRLTVWLDRRCDPNEPISFGANLPRLKDCLWKLANEKPDLDVAWLDDVIYIGPSNAANRLATVNVIHEQMLSKLSGSIGSPWRRRKSMIWPRLTSPVDLLNELEQELGREIRGKEQVTHDLWAAKRLPSLPLFQRLELLLVGFDLTFVFEPNGGAKIVTMPTEPRATERVSIPSERTEEIKELLAQHPTAKLDDRELAASWRVHKLVERSLEPPPDNRILDQLRYNLKAENQLLGNFVKSLCKQLELSCEFQGVDEAVLEQRISFEVHQASLRRLFLAILEPVGLQFELEDQQLRIMPKATKNE